MTTAMTNDTITKVEFKFFDKSENKKLKNSSAVLNMVQIEIEPNQFLQIKETLTRIGIASKKPKHDKPKLHQTCVILQKQGKYYIAHYKEMLKLDGTLKSKITDVDLLRRNKIVSMLLKWGLIKTSSLSELELDEINKPEYLRELNLTVVKVSEKDKWRFKPTYVVGMLKQAKATQSI